MTEKFLIETAEIISFTKISFYYSKNSSLIYESNSWPPASAINRASVDLPHFSATLAAWSKCPSNKHYFIRPSAPSSQLALRDTVSCIILLVLEWISLPGWLENSELFV